MARLRTADCELDLARFERFLREERKKMGEERISSREQHRPGWMARDGKAATLRDFQSEASQQRRERERENWEKMRWG